MRYTEEQLLELNSNMEINTALEFVFDALAESGKEMNMKEIGIKTGLSIYPRDKAILTLEFSGFIEKKERGSNKVYYLTEQGKRLYDIRGARK